MTKETILYWLKWEDEYNESGEERKSGLKMTEMIPATGCYWAWLVVVCTAPGTEMLSLLKSGVVRVVPLEFAILNKTLVWGEILYMWHQLGVNFT